MYSLNLFISIYLICLGSKDISLPFKNLFCVETLSCYLKINQILSLIRIVRFVDGFSLTLNVIHFTLQSFVDRSILIKYYNIDYDICFWDKIHWIYQYYIWWIFSWNLLYAIITFIRNTLSIRLMVIPAISSFYFSIGNTFTKYIWQILILIICRNIILIHKKCYILSEIQQRKCWK